MNKNGELAQSKIKLCLNQNKIKKIPGKYETWFDSSEVLIRKNKTSRAISGIDLAFRTYKKLYKSSRGSYKLNTERMFY